MEWKNRGHGGWNQFPDERLARSQEPIDSADQPVDDDFARKQAIRRARFFQDDRSGNSDRWTESMQFADVSSCVGERMRDN